MSKKYARIDQYGRLLVPLSMLEKIASECYICDTEYGDGKTVLSKLEPVQKVELVTSDEVEHLLMYKELSE
jgi:hypothetical protein